MTPVSPLTAVLVALLAAGCSQIGDGLPVDVPTDDDTDRPEPDQPSPDDDGTTDDEEQPEEELPATTPLILAPVPNLNYGEISAYSAVDGSYVRSFVEASAYDMAGGTRPVHASQGPDGRIYVVDESETIFVFTAEGVFTGPTELGGNGSGPGTIAVEIDESYYSVKSVDYRNGKLYATTSKGVIAGYSLTGKPQSPLLDLDASENLEDIHFLDDGRFLVSNATADEMQLYSADGELEEAIFSVDFPQQIQRYGSNFIVSSWMEDEVIEFNLSGVVERHGGEGIENPRGIAALSNGNMLVSVYLGSCAESGCKLLEVTDEAAVVETHADGPAVRRLEIAELP